MKMFRDNTGVKEFQNFKKFRRSLRYMTRYGISPITEDELNRLWNGEELLIHYGVGPTKIVETDPNTEVYMNA